MANEVISYVEMCGREGTSLQRGMNFGLRDDHSVALMSLRPGAPYRDRLEDDGTAYALASVVGERTPTRQKHWVTDGKTA